MKKYKDVEVVDAQRLMLDNIRHICVEVKRTAPNYFRAAKESEHLFHRAMIESLCGSNNAQVIRTKGHNKNKPIPYILGSPPWKEIQRIPPRKGKVMWRYSEPKVCPEPPDVPRVSDWPFLDGDLMGFDELLAMIQAEAFMCHYYGSKPLVLRDAEMEMIEEVHKNVRNEFEHFMPKAYLLTKRELIEASILCVSLSKILLFETNPFMRSRLPKAFSRLLDSVMETLISKVRYLPYLSQGGQLVLCPN